MELKAKALANDGGSHLEQQEVVSSSVEGDGVQKLLFFSAMDNAAPKKKRKLVGEPKTTGTEAKMPNTTSPKKKE